MSHSNISIFVPHLGCPNQCAFCNQHTISGKEKAPDVEDVEKACNQAVMQIKDKSNCEIAFFGGSFTAINREYMVSLLKSASYYVRKYDFSGIRISTRPDSIDEEILRLLKSYNVTAIELGAQSMNDNVLIANDRGHTSQDIVNASKLIKNFGFELGLQMMVGLYGATPEIDTETAEKIINIKPDTTRIYPTVILKNTKLGDLYNTGEYNPYTLEQAVNLCAFIYKKFCDNNIKVIKMGLHASEVVESQMLGGLYHPAFRELCENHIYRNSIIEICENNPKCNQLVISVPPKNVSKAVGQKKSNIEFFSNKGIKIKIVPDTCQQEDLRLVSCCEI